LEKSASDGFAPGRRAVAVSATAILAVGLPEVRRAEAEKISQRAVKIFVLQCEKLFAASQGAFRFHGVSVLHFNRGFKSVVDEFG
jgi:hypothetical protein